MYSNNLIRLLFVSISIALACSAATAQLDPKPGKTPATPAPTSPLRSSAAYAEVILRKTELEADLESLVVDYTEEYPKVKEARLELGLIQKEIDRLSAVKPADAGKLTSALGKLIVRKVALETDVGMLRAQYDDKHPDVVSAKKKVDIFEKAIKDILGP